MTTREKAPTILTAEGARRKIARVRDALALADDLLVDLFEGRAWEALGHASWEALVAAELPEMRLIKLRTPVRRERARKLLELGATEREIAAATGSSTGTAHNDVAFLTAPPVLKNEQDVFPTPLPRQLVEDLTNWMVVVRRVGRQGERGLTCQEFEAETGWSHGKASAACHAAERKGYVRRVPTYRGGYAAYVSTSRP